MIPVHLHISGFLSYQEPVDLDFSSFDLACISGQNGAGKSSLLEAITWVLFGQARRKDDALINSHSKGCQVVFEFDYEDHRYRISRSKLRDKVTVLEFNILATDGVWKVLTERAVRETEMRIEHVLRMDFETFTNASFFLQGKADQFAQQRPSERKRILSSILGLEIWEVFRERAVEKRKGIESELNSLNGVLTEIENELKEEDARRQKLKTLKETLNAQTALRQSKEASLEHLRRLSASLEEQKKWVEQLKLQWQVAVQKVEQNRSELETRSLELQGYQASLAQADQVEDAYRRWLLDREELERWNRIATDYHQQDAQRSAPMLVIETERARLEQERQTLAALSKQAQDLVDQIPGFENEIQRLQVLLSESTQQLEETNHLRSTLDTILQNQSEAHAENKRLRQEMNELKERIDRLNETSGVNCPLCGQPLNLDERQLLIQSLETQGRQMGDRYRQNQMLVIETTEHRQEIESRLTILPRLETELRNYQRQLDQVLDRKVQALAGLLDWQKLGAIRLLEVSRLLDENAYALDARSALIRMDADLKQLGYDAASHDLLMASEQAGRSSNDLHHQLEAARAALGPLEREIFGIQSRLNADLQDAELQQKNYQQALQKYQHDVTTIPDMGLVEAELMSCQEQENRLRMEVGAANQQVEVLKTLENRKNILNQQRETFQRQVSQLKILERAFGKDGVPALLIEQALPEIKSQANEILDRLSSGAMSVSFSTQKDYKDKNRDDKKETLDILISDAAGKREYEMFSGGEAFRVNFAIRLALSRVLSQRAGARLRMLVIDEGFGSQDVDGRQRLIQAINLVQPDFAKILVITHLEELKDAFPARIEVEKTLNGSIIKVMA